MQSPITPRTSPVDELLLRRQELENEIMLTKLQISHQEEEIKKRFSPILHNPVQRSILTSEHRYNSKMQTPKPVHTLTPEEEPIPVGTNRQPPHLVNSVVRQPPVGHCQPELYVDFGLPPPRVVQNQNMQPQHVVDSQPWKQVNFQFGNIQDRTHPQLRVLHGRDTRCVPNSTQTGNMRPYNNILPQNDWLARISAIIPKSGC